MKLTKYPQSCVLLEDDDRGRILVDLGSFATAAYDLADLMPLDAVLYTHQHDDHLDRTVAEQVLGKGIPIYANDDVCQLIGEGATVVTDGETIDVAGWTVTPRDAPHVRKVDGSPGPPNTGFVVDGRVYHPGDSIVLDGLKVDVLAVPIAGPSISFRDAYVMVEQSGADTVVPIHYDFFVAEPELFAKFCDVARVVALDPGESVDLG